MRSSEVSATPATTPSPPRSLKVTKPVGGGLLLTWLAPSSTGGSPITAYRIHRTDGTGAALIRPVGASPLSFLDTQIGSKQWYAYVVTAMNDGARARHRTSSTSRAHELIAGDPPLSGGQRIPPANL